MSRVNKAYGRFFFNWILFSDICWLRLDLETFSLAGPVGTVEANGGVCTDRFAVTVRSSTFEKKLFYVLNVFILLFLCYYNDQGSLFGIKMVESLCVNFRISFYLISVSQFLNNVYRALQTRLSHKSAAWTLDNIVRPNGLSLSYKYRNFSLIVILKDNVDVIYFYYHFV